MALTGLRSKIPDIEGVYSTQLGTHILAMGTHTAPIELGVNDAIAMRQEDTCCKAIKLPDRFGTEAMLL